MAGNGGGMANGTPNFFAHLMNGPHSNGHVNHNNGHGSLQIHDMEHGGGGGGGGAAYRYNGEDALPPPSPSQHFSRDSSELDLPQENYFAFVRAGGWEGSISI